MVVFWGSGPLLTLLCSFEFVREWESNLGLSFACCFLESLLFYPLSETSNLIN